MTQAGFPEDHLSVVTKSGDSIVIDSIHKFFTYQGEHPDVLNGLVLEKLIRDCVANASNPMHYKLRKLEYVEKSIQDDQMIYAD